MIDPDWTFHYVATLAPEGISDREVSALAKTKDGWQGGSMAGRAPRLRFWEEWLTLVATTTDDAKVKWFSHRLGDVVSRAARPGDTVEAVRDYSGSLAVVVRRDGALVAAVGALTSALVGPEAEIVSGGSSADIRVGADRRVLRERESAVIGGYDVYVELTTGGGLSGPSACFSIALASDAVLVNAARRSAVLLIHQAFESLRGERIDGSYVRDGGG